VTGGRPPLVFFGGRYHAALPAAGPAAGPIRPATMLPARRSAG
jgi:hypothetical protein